MTTTDNKEELERLLKIPVLGGDIQELADGIEAYAQAHTKAALLALREKAELLRLHTEPPVWEKYLSAVSVDEIDKALGADKGVENE